jgi:sulfite exporter TauE/SafE
MFDPTLLTGTAAGVALLTGLGGSPHCALMCGPLAGTSLDGDARARRRVAAAWQGGRVGAYAACGALLGGLGRGALALLGASAARVLPWLMVLGLLISAFEVGRRLPRFGAAAALSRALARAGAHFSRPMRAACRGAATAFLPCGLLYGAFVVAVGTGSPLGGAATMTAFAVGGLPALALVQMNVRRLTAHPRAGWFVRRAIPLLAAALVVWRTLSANAGAPPPCH